MRKVNREIHFATAISPLLAVGALAAVCFPPGWSWLAELGAVVVFLLVALALAATGFVISRSTRHAGERPHESARLECQPPLSATTIPPRIEPALRLRQQLHNLDWFQFEKLVGLIYGELGYSVERRGGANSDGGIDLVLRKDGEQTAVQCKQWKVWKVSIRTTREFLGAIMHAGINQGILITLKGYTRNALELADTHRIKILDVNGLIDLIEQSKLRDNAKFIQLIQDRAKYCPKCEAHMVLRRASKGPNAGQSFWGCSNYATARRCRFTLPVVGSHN